MSAAIEIFKNFLCSHEGVWGRTFIAPHILNLGAKQKKMAALTPQPLYPGKKALHHPLNVRLGDSLFCTFLQYVHTLGVLNQHLSCKADKRYGESLLADVTFDANTCTWRFWIRAELLTARAREAD
jgi:hypothetical protein